MMEKGLLIVVSGPSGAGKGTICKQLLKDAKQVNYSISATTRLPRKGEQDGKDYLFLTREEFLEMRDDSAFLEWAEVYGNFYGTPQKNVEEQLSKGTDVILEIDIQGALQIKKKFPEAIFIFIVPPSLEELETRINRRGTDSREVIRKRLHSASKELEYVSEYDYVVINDILDMAVERVKAIITAEKCRPHRKQIIFN